MTAATAAPAEQNTASRALAGLVRHRALLRRFILNDALGRYRGSALGLCWSFLNPLLLLAVFTIAFGALFGGSGWYDDLPAVPIVLPIFCGMVVFGIFGEVLSRAPTSILAQPNYVKKVIFPLEILPASILGSALLHACIGLAMLVVGQLALGQGIHWQIVFLPLVLLPLVLFTLGLAWFLASLGVFVRDIAHSMGVLTQVFFFLTPVVYPFKAAHAGRVTGDILAWSPLTIAVEQTRRLVIWGELPSARVLALMTAASAVVLWLGARWFDRTRPGFADVV